jgi:hypothetical protein
VTAEEEEVSSTLGVRTSELGGAGKRNGDLEEPSRREELEAELEEDIIERTSEN